MIYQKIINGKRKIIPVALFTAIIAISGCGVGPTSYELASNSITNNPSSSNNNNQDLRTRRISETEELCTRNLGYFLSNNQLISDINSENQFSVKHHTFVNSTDTYRDRITFYYNGDKYGHTSDCTIQFLQPESVTFDFTSLEDIDRHLSGDYYFKLLEFTVDGEKMLQEEVAGTNNATANTNNITEKPQPTENPQPTPIPIPSIGRITMAKGVSASGNPIEPTSYFPEGTKEVHAVFEYENMRPEMQVTTKWTRNGGEGAGGTYDWWGKESGVESIFLHNNSEVLLSGNYEVRIYVDNKLMQSAEFNIGETKSEQIGKTKISDRDGMEMVTVRERVHRILPNVDITVWVDKIPVTNEMFASYLNQIGNQIQQGTGTSWYDASSIDAQIGKIDGIWKAKEGYEKKPAVEVTWYGAWHYCQWAGRELSPYGSNYSNDDLVIIDNISEWGGFAPPGDNHQPLIEGDDLNQPVRGPNNFETKPTNSFKDVGFRCVIEERR